MPNPFQVDPSRTTMIRRQFVADIHRRMKALEKKNRELIVDDDVFGLNDPQSFTILQQVPKQAWRFLSDAQKVATYRVWLQEQIDLGLLTVDAIDPLKPWTATYVESAYQKGVVRSYIDVHKQDLATKGAAFYQGGMEQFLLDAFAAPQLLNTVELLYMRSFTELKGVTDVMSQQMSRILAEGFANGHGPAKIAREMRKQISTLTKRRADLIAHTEVIRAHAEGQLDSLRMLGIDEVGLLAEWSTAGDDRVCPLCGDLDGVVLTIDEATGLIPRHPRCRCSWAPTSKAIKEQDQKRGGAALKAIRESIKSEGPKTIKRTFKETKDRSAWAGKELL